ncbi:hypothetical protein BISA_0953 [Bifidobacterium saguini DSM 23967]|uniref:Cell wall synthesis protein Wag31 n=2 Tax=Bifidobacterium saguini TaxID=762210 RepID=A0A087D816_9BIFI|nr:DivIVA domain-containing protein [Bifidobacterium saguini]KFI91666.1 hypothetical protein BISA_0953 [Bifidobacterium saguini DSM 23967]
MVSVKDIETKTFQTVRFKEGYDVDEVDVFLDQVVARAKAGNPMTPAEIAAQTFQTVRFKEGYDTGEVDEFLTELANGVTVAPSDNKSDTNNASVATAAAPSVVSSKDNANRFDSGSPSVTDSSSTSGEDPFSGGNAQVPW